MAGILLSSFVEQGEEEKEGTMDHQANAMNK